MTTNHEEFERLADELQPDAEKRRTIVSLAETISAQAWGALEKAHSGDADEVIRHATIVAAHCYRIVGQLGGNLDEELARLRDELRTGDRLRLAIERQIESEALVAEGA
jgi:predicted translin family RNA/ssDNA-binding protein